MGKLFGTDGVRGVANKELTPELAFRLGRAAAYFFGQEHNKPVFVIGRDTRLSGQMLEAALAAGICSVGGQAVLVGVVPTPAVAFLTSKLGAQAGIVISASHNPYPDNGIKFFAGNGYKLPDEVEDQLEQVVLQEGEVLPRPVADRVGAIQQRHDLIHLYVDYLVNTVNVSLEGLKVVVDCANGAAYEVASMVLERLGADLTVIHHRPNGININRGCGSTHLESLQEAVVDYGAHIGIAYDGDADRCLAVDEYGRAVDGDQIMVICALEMLRTGHLTDNTLVTTVMSNIGLHQAIKKAGGRVEVTQVGDRYVLESMQKGQWVLGGEQSGHIIFGEYSTTGDGVLTSIQLLASLKKSGKPMSEMAAVMVRYPQMLVNVRVKSKEGWQENSMISEAIQTGTQTLGDDGRILVRASGTEPLIRVMAEGPDMKCLENVVHSIADTIKSQLDGYTA